VGGFARRRPVLGGNRASRSFASTIPTPAFALLGWLARKVQAPQQQRHILAEAFTRPKIMKNSPSSDFPVVQAIHMAHEPKPKLQEYLSELTRYPEREYFRAEFLRDDARHPARPVADRRAVAVQVACRACRYAVRTTASITASNCSSMSRSRTRGVSRLGEIRNPNP